MTQRSAPVVSATSEAVRSIRPQKIEPCWLMSKAANVKPHDDPEELRPVTGEHLDRDPAHRLAPS